MPLYNLRCKNPECGHEFQKTQRMNDPNPPCPKCSHETEKVIKRMSFVLKGEGWFNKGGY